MYTALEHGQDTINRHKMSHSLRTHRMIERNETKRKVMFIKKNLKTVLSGIMSTVCY